MCSFSSKWKIPNMKLLPQVIEDFFGNHNDSNIELIPK